MGDYDLDLVVVVLWVMYLYVEKSMRAKSPAKSMRATLACLFNCVCIALVL